MYIMEKISGYKVQLDPLLFLLSDVTIGILKKKKKKEKGQCPMLAIFRTDLMKTLVKSFVSMGLLQV